jgi:signal transduction histidine kinase
MDAVATTVIVSTLGFLLLIAGVIITVFISNRRNAMQEMKMAQMQLDFEKEMRKVEFEVQEQVLVNIGRELHDNIGQLLTYMNMQLEQYKFVSTNPPELLDSMGGTLTDTIQEVRRLGKSLNSDLFESQGLVQAVQQEVTRLRQLNKYEIAWEYDKEPLLDKNQKVITYRILQEMLNNIMKHAGGSVIRIKMSTNGRFRLVVEDNGKGFDYDGIMKTSKGSGLKNIVKRAEMAKFACNFKSIIGKGTTFTLETTS